MVDFMVTNGIASQLSNVWLLWNHSKNVSIFSDVNGFHSSWYSLTHASLSPSWQSKVKDYDKR